MPTPDPLKRRLSDLQLDLRIERDKLSELVGSLEQLEGRMQAGSANSETFDSAALRLQSLYTGAERCLLVRKAIATEWRPAVLSPAVRVGLAELRAFHHGVRHLYAYELEADRVRLLLQLDVPPERIAGDSCARTTWENSSLASTWIRHPHPGRPRPSA